jgi:hypothetical protein
MRIPDYVRNLSLFLRKLFSQIIWSESTEPFSYLQKLICHQVTFSSLLRNVIFKIWCLVIFISLCYLCIVHQESNRELGA